MFESEGEDFFHEPEVSCRDGMQQLPIDNSNTSDPGPTKTSNEKKVFKCDVCPMVMTACVCVTSLFSHAGLRF